MDYSEIRDIVVSDNRGMVYEEGGIHVYRASGIGSCTRALVASLLGYRESRYQKTQKILDDAAKEGNLHEGAIMASLEEMGHRLETHQDTVEKQVIPGVIIRGHTDGRGKPPKARNDRGYEAKTMSQDRYRKWMSHPTFVEAMLSGQFDKYAWQLSVYMHATGLPFVYAVKNRNSGELSIEEIAVPLVDWKTIRRKVIAVEKWVKRDDLPPCDVSGGEKYFCPFVQLHDDGFGDEGDDDFEPITSVQDVVLIGMAERHADLSTIVRAGDAARKERTEVGEKMLTAMAGQKKVIAGGWEISHRTRKRTWLDKDQMAEELGIDRRHLDMVMEANTKELEPSQWVQVKEA